MSTHTPGPWHVAKGGLGREIRADDGPFIASVYDHTFTYGERNANACLIAAAPELLEALIKLTNESAGFLAMPDPDAHGHTNRAVLRDRIRLAQDAIAKAGGHP